MGDHGSSWAYNIAPQVFSYGGETPDGDPDQWQAVLDVLDGFFSVYPQSFDTSLVTVDGNGNLDSGAQANYTFNLALRQCLWTNFSGTFEVMPAAVQNQTLGLFG